MKDKLKVAVGLSGGVDSSVAAMILKDQGFEVIGVTMTIFDDDPTKYQGKQNACYGPDEKEDVEKARQLCKKLGIDYYVIDLKKEYKDIILNYFTEEYSKGRTPNPCVKCNWKMKFGAMIDKLKKQVDFDLFATGHYAQIEQDANTKRYALKKARDQTKDQTYFLHNLSQEQLSQTIFPLGQLKKSQVKKLAEKLGMGLEQQKESQNFIAGGHKSLLENEASPGKITDRSGTVLGEHKGIQFYTIGQRKGHGIASTEALYVTKIIKETNTLILGPKQDLYKDQCGADQINWISFEPENKCFSATAKIRYGQQESDVLVTPVGKHEASIAFNKAQMAISPGQSIVFYQREFCLGGGIITTA